MPTTSRTLEATDLLTPGLLASVASSGRWSFAKHLQMLDDTVMQLLTQHAMGTVTQTDTPRVLVIEAPPRHGKSEYCSFWLPSWYLLRWPRRKVMLVSHGAGMARLWGRRVRANVSEWGAELPKGMQPVAISEAAKASHDWETTHGGAMVTAGVGGPITGRGAHLLIIDDYIKNAEQALSETIRDSQWDWLNSTAFTRLEPGGVAIVMGTRWHPEDLIGRLVADAETGGAPLTRLRMPAIGEDGAALWAERWPLETLEEQRERDAAWFAAMYQQTPSRGGRAAWPDEYFQGDIWTDAQIPHGILSVLAIDPATGSDARKGDYSAIVRVALHAGIIMVDAWIERFPPERLIERTYRMIDESGGNVKLVAVEGNGFQSLLANEIDRSAQRRNRLPLPVHLWTNTENKTTRVLRLGTYLGRKKVRFVRNAHTELLVRQLRDFPLGKHDDGPDALEMAIRTLDLALTAQQTPSRDYGRAIAV